LFFEVIKGVKNHNVIFCVNEVINKFIKHNHIEGVSIKGTDNKISGKTKKVNIFVINNQASGKVKFIGEYIESFRYRVVFANIKIL
jgi:hypothetical protein